MSDVEQVPAILTVIEDEGEYVVRSSGARGRQMAQGVLASLSGATRVTVISDNDVKVFRNKNGHKAVPPLPPQSTPQATTEIKAEESAPPPASKRIVQDTAAPPAPELAEEHMAELRRQQEEEAALREQQRFNSQEVAQTEPEAEPEQPRRKTRERQLAVGGSVCGRCAGSGQVVGDAGFQGMCPVCQGKGEIKAWGRGRRSK